MELTVNTVITAAVITAITSTVQRVSSVYRLTVTASIINELLNKKNCCVSVLT